MFDISIWIGAALMGLSLGILGSGGSILTVPLLVYIAKEPDKLAIAESLLIVGVVALVGSIAHIKKRNIAFDLFLLFGIPSMFAAYGGAHLSQYVSAHTQLTIFAVVMLGASGLMLRPFKAPVEEHKHNKNVLVFAGVCVGTLAGLVGVGGGFLIVPALLLIAKPTMKKAIATSLFIIAFQSLAGFSNYALNFSANQASFNWPLIILVTGFALSGVFIGSWISEKLPQATLKKLFGVALIPLSLFIFVSNV